MSYMIGVGNEKASDETRLLVKCFKEAQALVSTTNTERFGALARQVYGHIHGAHLHMQGVLAMLLLM